MEIELTIDGELKKFEAKYVPMMAKRRFMEIQSEFESKERELTTSELLEEEDEMIKILVDIVFKNQFTTEQLMKGASNEYLNRKIAEAIYGIKAEDIPIDAPEGDVNG